MACVAVAACSIHAVCSSTWHVGEGDRGCAAVMFLQAMPAHQLQLLHLYAAYSSACRLLLQSTDAVCNQAVAVS
jgi:hypothetical protein